MEIGEKRSPELFSSLESSSKELEVDEADELEELERVLEELEPDGEELTAKDVSDSLDLLIS